jgi:sulfide dehydrogenase cytochrome subunit
MKQHQALKTAAMVIGLALAGNVSADMASSEALGITCAGCHGTNGVSTGPATPSIAGLSSAYLVEAMENYKSGESYSTIMGRIAKGYSTAEFEAMGDFFAKQKFVTANQKAGSKVKAGEKLHNKNCEKCHSEGGSLAEDDAGILAGQWTPYLRYTLMDMLAGDHPMPKKMKKKVAKQHKKENMEAILDYYSSNQ